MVLSDREIKECIRSGAIEVSGVEELYIGPSSLDLHLDNKAMILDPTKITEDHINLSDKEKIAKLFTAFNGWDDICIMPGEFYLLSSVERIKFADNVVGFIQGRSSIARVGINIHTAGYFDAGFEGTATLEVTNFTRQPISIPKNTRICQMVFARMKEPAEIPYSKKKDSKYQQQTGPTITSVYQDYEKNS